MTLYRVVTARAVAGFTVDARDARQVYGRPHIMSSLGADIFRCQPVSIWQQRHKQLPRSLKIHRVGFTMIINSLKPATALGINLSTNALAYGVRL